jgi:ribosome recycling factor
MIDDVMHELDAGSEKAVDYYKRELGKLRTGRANPALLDSIRVEYYGTATPINQMATVSVPENRVIVIAPWDTGQLDPIVKALQKANLDITPASDGKIIRLVFPALTEDRRKDIVKQIRKMAEEAKIALRQERRGAIDIIKDLEKEGDISEDDSRRATEKVQKMHDEFIKQADEIADQKEKEIMEI